MEPNAAEPNREGRVLAALVATTGKTTAEIVDAAWAQWQAYKKAVGLDELTGA